VLAGYFVGVSAALLSGGLELRAQELHLAVHMTHRRLQRLHLAGAGITALHYGETWGPEC